MPARTSRRRFLATDLDSVIVAGPREGNSVNRAEPLAVQCHWNLGGREQRSHPRESFARHHPNPDEGGRHRVEGRKADTCVLFGRGSRGR